jgi:hypothetical protein
MRRLLRSRGVDREGGAPVRTFAPFMVATLVLAACLPAGQTSEEPGEPSGPASQSAGPSIDPADEIDAALFGSTYSAEEGTPGGSVVISDWQPVEQLNPYYSSGFKNTQVFASTMLGLFTVSHDGKWTPDLAVSVPTIANGGVVLDEEVGVAECPLDEEAYAGYPAEPTPGFAVNLEIDPNLLWSDGETLDLNDLAYTRDWILDPEQTGLVAGTTGWDLIDSFEVSDDGLSATVHFCRGFAGFYGLLSTSILPERDPGGRGLRDLVSGRPDDGRGAGLGSVSIRERRARHDRAGSERELQLVPGRVVHAARRLPRSRHLSVLCRQGRDDRRLPGR